MTGPRRFRLAGEEPDQVDRLAAFRQAHPEVVIGTDEDFRTWEARYPLPAGERTIVRHTLRKLLDRLDVLLGKNGAG